MAPGYPGIGPLGWTQRGNAVNDQCHSERRSVEPRIMWVVAAWVGAHLGCALQRVALCIGAQKSGAQQGTNRLGRAHFSLFGGRIPGFRLSRQAKSQQSVAKPKLDVAAGDKSRTCFDTWSPTAKNLSVIVTHCRVSFFAAPSDWQLSDERAFFCVDRHELFFSFHTLARCLLRTTVELFSLFFNILVSSFSLASASRCPTW